ncbi:Secretory immunoglobulin A-binding protein EsiB [Gracilariopsis chorda]|uniref:Secretory immunoglobulin A-binding protein EsiB n=1 Tax=Gracilariopsis chorda TaxID=448386 RepID=A0A2V3J2P1_9FLOR|nr:Secretory immunoglobulin A-binding protein EsiB [Gracilariopsis chorda]|eukprot:PXF48603.1 Secretory immunoglobulin A-binding protein EsiB [Gracilariopsis chorda]
MSSDAHCDADGVRLSACSVARALEACLRAPTSIDIRLRTALSALLNALTPHSAAQLDPPHHQSLADIAALASLVQHSLPDLLPTRYAPTLLHVLTSLSALFHCLEAFFHAPTSTTDPITALGTVPKYDSQPLADAKVPSSSADRYIALLSAHRSFLNRLQRIALPPARVKRLRSFAATLIAQRRLEPARIATEFAQPTFSNTNVIASNAAAHIEYALFNLRDANNESICNTAVALKFFRVTDASRQHYFGQEALRLRTLSHPCIPLFHGVYANFHRHVSESCRVVVATERMTCNLRTAKSLPAMSSFRTRLKVLRDVANALAFLHCSRVYHAAVRPENVLLRIQGRSIYGVAKLDVTCLLRRALQLPAARPKIYEPPELYTDQHYTYYTGDVWSFGVLATFLMTVYSSDDEDDIKFVGLVTRSGFSYPARLWAKTIRYSLVRELVAKCLEENPANRPTAVQLVNEIDEIQRFYDSNLYCDAEKDVAGELTLRNVTGAERRPNGACNPNSCSGPSCNGCTFCSRGGRGPNNSRKSQHSLRGVVPRTEGDGKQLPTVKEEPSGVPVVAISRRLVKVEENEVGVKRNNSHSSSRRRKRRRLRRHISSDDENDELYGDSIVNPVEGLASTGNGAAVPLFEQVLMNEGLNDSHDSSAVRIKGKRRRSQQDLGNGSDYSFDLSSGLLSKLNKGLTQAPPVAFAKLARSSVEPSQTAQQPIPNTCEQSRKFCKISKPSPSAGAGQPRASASKDAEMNMDAEKRSASNLPNKVQTTPQVPFQFALDLDSGKSRVPTMNTKHSRFSARAPAVNGNGKPTVLNIAQSHLLANQPSTIKAEPGFSTSLSAVGDHTWASLGDIPSTRVSFDMVQNIVQLHSNAQQRQANPVRLYTADDVMNTFGNSKASAQEGDKKRHSTPNTVEKKRRRSSSAGVKVEGPERENERKKKDQKQEECRIKTEGGVVPSNSPWAGRMRKRTQRKYFEESPVYISDSDSIDFVNGASESPSGKEYKAKTPTNEKTPFLHLISITDKNFKQLSQSLGEHGQQGNVGIRENNYSIMNDDVDSVYALGVIKGSRIGLNPFQYFKREATKGDTSAQVRLGILYENGAGGQQDYAAAFYYYSEAASKGDSEGQLRLGRCYDEGRGVLQSESTAVRFYAAAAEKNHPIAHYKVAKCFLEGRGVKRDVRKAATHFEEAVDGHILEAAVCLADLYKEGKHILQDFSKAFQLYRSAANSGSVTAKVKLAHCYAKGSGCRRAISKAVELYKEASDYGDPDAKLSLGLLYEDGNGVKASCEKALKFYKESAWLGHAPGVTALGQCFLWGYGLPKDFSRAKSLFEVAAEKGDALAMHELGNCYRDGNGCEKDMKKAVSYYSMASAKGSAVSLVEYGECYYYGKVVGVDYDKAFKLFSKAAELGAAEGYRWLGDCYTDGVGTEKNYKKAVELHRKAVELGSSVSQLCLGNMYENGLGVEKNKVKALSCYRKSAERGNFTALNNLGILYEKGELVKQDYKRAVRYYEQAKDLGCIDAVCNLADCYTAGNGVPRNYDIAFKLYQEAASGDLPGAVCEMGVCYYQGRGVQQNFAEAMEALNKVKDREPEALRQLGVIHYDGKAVQRDFEKAIEFYRKAIDLGNTNAYLSLAVCFLNGEGVQKNEDYAVELLGKAADGGNRMAFMYLGNCYFEGRGVTKDSRRALHCYRKGQDADPLLS